jgi:hypothetical protein
MAYDKDIEIKRLRRLVDWLQSDRVLELRATLDAAIRDTFCTLLKEHGSEEFRPSASPSLDDSSSLLAQPKVAPSPGTEDAQARPFSPAPSARGAGARWIANDSGWGWKCSKCGARIGANEASEHEASCWPSPAVSARQDADAGEEKPREGAGFDWGGHWLALVNRVVKGCTIHPMDHSRGIGEVRRELSADASDALEALVRMGPVTYMGPPRRAPAAPIDIGDCPTPPWVYHSACGYSRHSWNHGYIKGWSAARARALKMSSEPRGAQEESR